MDSGVLPPPQDCAAAHTSSVRDNNVEYLGDLQAFGPRKSRGEEHVASKGHKIAPPSSVHVLYRATITDRLFEEVESWFEPGRGTLVSGPQGIGKSHSLINLVLKLQASGKYLLTFLPNCEKWGKDVYFLLDAICGSFGIDLDGIGWESPSGIHEIQRDFHAVVACINKALEGKGKRWFDQVNTIFSSLLQESPKKIYSLPFPYKAMHSLQLWDRITSVISASSNNEVSPFRDEDFVDFSQPTEMSDNELRTLFFQSTPAELLEKSLASVREAAGSVPQKSSNTWDVAQHGSSSMPLSARYINRQCS
jgi:energy-coupling factor transporter ATP-binding protein EcfA2